MGKQQAGKWERVQKPEEGESSKKAQKKRGRTNVFSHKCKCCKIIQVEVDGVTGGGKWGGWAFVALNNQA